MQVSKLIQSHTFNVIIKPILLNKESILNDSILNFLTNRNQPVFLEDISIIKEFVKELAPNYIFSEKSSEGQYELSIYKVKSHNSYKLNLSCFGSRIFLHVQFGKLVYTQYQHYNNIIQNYQINDEKYNIIYNLDENKYQKDSSVFTYNSEYKTCIVSPSGYNIFGITK